MLIPLFVFLELNATLDAVGDVLLTCTSSYNSIFDIICSFTLIIVMNKTGGKLLKIVYVLCSELCRANLLVILITILRNLAELTIVTRACLVFDVLASFY
jgi:hypothetical protein